MRQTTAEYINNLHFEYFETYSFQRKGNFEKLRLLYEKRKNGERLNADDNKLYEEIKNTTEKHLYSNKIFDEWGNLNHSADKVAAISNKNPSYLKLIQILQTPIEEEMFWMCAPVYRDAILFYNVENELVGGINICFECDRIESINKKEISTDYKTFKYLKLFLLGLGHPIENPASFKTTDIERAIEKNKKEQKIWADWRARREKK